MTLNTSRILIGLLVAYTSASALHFIHNAIFLNSYPNMPDWISRVEVYAALAAVIAIGVVGVLFFVSKYRTVGLIVIGVYAAFGFDGLAHYGLAPISAHTIGMNVTIWLEVVTAALLLATVIILIGSQLSAESGRSRND